MSPFPIIKDTYNTLGLYSDLEASAATKASQPYPTSNDLPPSCVTPYTKGASNGQGGGHYCWDTYQLNGAEGVSFFHFHSTISHLIIYI